MKQRCGRLGLIVGVILLSVRPATADPVLITGGYLDMTSTTGSLLLQGEEFMLTGGVSATDGVFQPWLQCNLIPSCIPGAMLDLDARWTGSSIRSATVTLHGETFTNVGGATSTTSASVNFTGSAIAPAFVGETATLVAPFVFQGQFTHLNASFERLVETLTGEGTVTVLLRRNATLATWNYATAKYEFQPIPEPATVLLTAAGITTLLARRRRSRRTNGPRG
jgi:hypothetical protein